MNIDWAVTCRYAESDGLVATIVGAGVDLLRVAELPGAIGSMVAVRLAGAPEELGPDKTHQLTVRILAPDGEPVRDPAGNVVPALEAPITSDEPVEQAVPGWLVNPLFTFGVSAFARSSSFVLAPGVPAHTQRGACSWRQGRRGGPGRRPHSGRSRERRLVEWNPEGSGPRR